MMPQAQFLEFLKSEASHYEDFQLVMDARVEHLIEHDGVIVGVWYRGSDGMYEVQADLTIGADGRFSRVRSLAQLASIKLAAPIDLLWFKLPSEPGDDQEEGAQLYFGAGHFLVAFYRYEYWQVGYGFLKGGYQQLRASGIEGLRTQVEALAPRFAEKMVNSVNVRRFFRSMVGIMGQSWEATRSQDAHPHQKGCDTHASYQFAVEQTAIFRSC